MDSTEQRHTVGDLDRYPSQLTCDVVTGDGRAVHLRPIRPDDGSRLRQFHEHLSPRSVYLRYFFMHPRLSFTEVDRLTHVDYVDRLALIGEEGGRIVAVGRYERTPGTAEAEVAFVVEDEYQHQGLGSLLLARLADAALANGVTVFVAETLAENRGMIDVFLKSGFPVSTSTEYGTVHVRFPIDPVADRPGPGEEGARVSGKPAEGSLVADPVRGEIPVTRPVIAPGPATGP